MNVRRHFLKTAVRGAAALFASDAAAKMGSPNVGFVSPGRDYPAVDYPAVRLDPNQELISRAENAFWRKQSRLRRVENSRHYQDLDLTVLGSTSPGWKASRQAAREEQRQTIIDKFNDKIRALREKPTQKIEGWLADLLEGATHGS